MTLLYTVAIFSTHNPLSYCSPALNGAGKTTTIRVLLGLIHATSGTASIFGRAVTARGGQIYRDVGYVPAEARHYPDMTGAQVLEYSASFYPQADARWTSEMVERMQFDPSRRVRTYSHGNRRKLGIIQALLHKPRLAILDEPSSGLDPLIRLELFRLLKDINQQGTTIFFSTHVLEEVERFCSRVGVIKDGRVTQVSPVDQMPGREMKLITARLAGGKPPDEGLTSWGQPAELEDTPGFYRFTVRGSANDIIARLAELDLEYVRVADPTVEDVFLAMYDPKGGNADV